jgi:nicotinate-nucleotide adenylyltransferase
LLIGVFGGSFDPVHLGHLWVAEAAAESLGLDQIRWIPTATSPLKRNGPIASSETRLQMLKLALAGSPVHVVDDRELKRGKISYTVDTLESLHEEFPNDEFVLIIGSDSLATFDQWRSPARILALAKLAVVQRGGDPPVDWSVLDKISDASHHDPQRLLSLAVPTIEISSSDLRTRLRDGRSIRYRTPRAVEALLESEKIYQDAAST